jgi:hypothetical protein
MNWIYRDRHWMHIWKVGYQSCISCRNDSRVVASLLDEAGGVVEQKLFCEDHAPWRGISGRWAKPSDDSLTDINLELGATFEPD